ncbi:MAG TPA: DUF72 domain-containing protein [Nitrospiraceae bacterium]|jgi:uncharacterized protein YecE (DUF72 family)|nr:DUF72 domain-containing protein [Nitrospiraceae bacterium]
MILTGTCSWTEKTLIQSGKFYPKEANTAEARLRYYAETFDTVEIDSTYYAIPNPSNSSLWAERTPEKFIFNVKAYGALTGHGVDPRTLPADIRKTLPQGEVEKKHIYIKDSSLLKTVAEMFREALEPLVKGGKLGVLVFQYPPWFQYSKAGFDFILQGKELMDGLPVALEFRHGSWLTPEKRDKVLEFLSKNNITYIAADEPQYGTLATVPFVPALTSDIAYFRFHGRNKENWLRKGIETTLRFAYKYSEEELRGFVPAIEQISKRAKTTLVMFNNCHLDYAVRNAIGMRELLTRTGETVRTTE